MILHDLRTRWAGMDSVILNRTLQEDWRALADSGSQWSHCAVVPLYILYMSLAGIRPLEPGFTRCEIHPQLNDLERLYLIAHTVQGPIVLDSQGSMGNRVIGITLPDRCEGELVVQHDERIDLEPLPGHFSKGFKRYRLPPGSTTKFHCALT